MGSPCTFPCVPPCLPIPIHGATSGAIWARRPCGPSVVCQARCHVLCSALLLARSLAAAGGGSRRVGPAHPPPCSPPYPAQPRPPSPAQPLLLPSLPPPPPRPCPHPCRRPPLPACRHLPDPGPAGGVVVPALLRPRLPGLPQPPHRAAAGAAGAVATAGAIAGATASRPLPGAPPAACAGSGGWRHGGGGRDDGHCSGGGGWRHWGGGGRRSAGGVD